MYLTENMFRDKFAKVRRSCSSPGFILGWTRGETAADSLQGATSLRWRLPLVMYVVIFLYAAAFWIQTGVLPVNNMMDINTYRHDGILDSASVPLQEAGC